MKMNFYEAMQAASQYDDLIRKHAVRVYAYINICEINGGPYVAPVVHGWLLYRPQLLGKNIFMPARLEIDATDPFTAFGKVNGNWSGLSMVPDKFADDGNWHLTHLSLSAHPEAANVIAGFSGVCSLPPHEPSRSFSGSIVFPAVDVLWGKGDDICDHVLDQFFNQWKNEDEARPRHYTLDFWNVIVVPQLQSRLSKFGH
jgi:hypothetical protein